MAPGILEKIALKCESRGFRMNKWMNGAYDQLA